jgi:hypothetical protein
VHKAEAENVGVDVLTLLNQLDSPGFDRTSDNTSSSIIRAVKIDSSQQLYTKLVFLTFRGQ